MGLSRGTRAALTAAITAACTVAAAPASGVAAAAKQRHESAKAKVVVTVSAPKGVPANATLRARGLRRTLAKKPQKRAARFTVRVREGRIRLSARALVYDGTPYRAVVTPRRATARPRHATRVRVRYVRVEAARRLRATAVTGTEITLDWQAPRRAVVQLRRTDGERPASSVRRGKRVRTKGRKAVDRGLKAGKTYSYALFTKTRHGWVGPVAVTAGTATTDPRVAAYVAPPTTVVVEPGEADVPTVVPGGVSVKLAPKRPTPVIGAGFVLPASATLPSGFLGTVASVSDDGRTVVLIAAGLADAFDYYNIDVDLGTVAPIPLTPSAGAATPRSARAAQAHPRAALPAALKRCLEGSAEGSVVLHPTLQPSGHFRSSLVKTWGVPVGATFDVGAQLTVGLTADVEVNAALSCGLPFDPVIRNIAVSPVPIAIAFDPAAEVSIGGQMSARNVGYTATGGFWTKGEIGRHNSIDGGLIKQGGPTTPNTPWSVPVTLTLGGELTVGPGAGTGAAGAIAGVGGKLIPLKASFGPVFGDGDLRRGACIKATAGMESELNVNAKAWAGPLKISRSLTIDALQFNSDYGGPWYLPSDCDKLPAAPSAAPSSDVLGPGVQELESTTTGTDDQWGHADGFAPGEKAWILSTGRIADASVNNPSSQASTGLNGPGSPALSALIGGEDTYDAASYKVTLKPTGDMLHVRYVFGSEEYPEYVGEGYDDVMAVFVNGQNCAKVPGTDDRVSVDSVNATTNAAFYVDNSAGAAGYQTSMDGLTKPLTCDVPVTPGQPVTVEVALADTGDHIYDSVVGLVDKGIWSD